jgi:hypothetical protein
MPEFYSLEITYAKDQEPYLPLPALPVDDGTGQGRVVTRWRMSLRERLRVLIHGDVYLWISTFGQKLQPVALVTTPPEILK